MNHSRWSALHAQVHHTFRQRQLFPRRSRGLVAVSGGQDSLCLMQLLLDLCPKWGWELAIGHCDHRWRGDSAENARHVQRLADQWQVPCWVVTADVALTSEAAARDWRYRSLVAMAQTQGYSYLVTGHTASDRAETLLFNLLRGSGADGLQSLTWHRLVGSASDSAEQAPIAIIRPLLTVSRAETAEFCRNAHLPIWEDATNRSLQYARNRIRQELIPYLQTHFNPQVEQTLAQTAEILTAEIDWLEAEVTQLWQRAVVGLPIPDPAAPSSDRQSATPDIRVPPKVDRLVLRSAPVALQRRVIRRFLQALLPLAPSFDHIEKFRALLTAPHRSQTDPFPGQWIAQVDGQWVVVGGGELGQTD